MTPHDYDFLRKCLKERSGLVLSADKQYLVESRLLPVARRAGLDGLGALVATLKGTGRGAAAKLWTSPALDGATACVPNNAADRIACAVKGAVAIYDAK